MFYPITFKDLELLFPDVGLAALEARLEGVLRGEWGVTGEEEEGAMFYPPPVECEVEEVILEDEEETEDFQKPEVIPNQMRTGYLPSRKNKTFTHAQKLGFVRLCRANGGNVLETARSLGLQTAALRRWRDREAMLEAQVLLFRLMLPTLFAC